MPSKTLTDHWHEFVAKEELKNKPVLLMVSGGVDSMVMLDVAVKHHGPHKVYVLHVNHNTRPESDDDAAFVQTYCEQRGVTCAVVSLVNKAQHNKEATWREYRQKAAREWAERWKTVRTLTAHHATDVVETMVFRLAKGAGMVGMSPFDVSTKPFWKVSKQNIRDYAIQQQLTWREDSTNSDLAYERNRVRHQIVPELRSITANLEAVFVRMHENFADIHTWIQQELEGEYVRGHVELNTFHHWPAGKQKAFLHGLPPAPPSSTEIDDARRWLCSDPQGNTQKKLGGRLLRLRKGMLSWE